MRAFQAIAQFDPRRGFATWLFTIARRKCIDHNRAAPPAPAEESMPEPPDLADPAELLAQREDRQSLWQIARRRLPEAQFQALWLRYAEDMSVAGIARVLRKTRTHVKVLLFRAREVLRHDLKATPILGRTIPGVAADVSRRHAGSAQNAPNDQPVRKSSVGEGERPREPKHPSETRDNQGSRGRSPSHDATFHAACDIGDYALSVNRAKCDVEFSGAVAGAGPGSGKKGLL